jgi:hypothetical protein
MPWGGVARRTVWSKEWISAVPLERASTASSKENSLLEPKE